MPMLNVRHLLALALVASVNLLSAQEVCNNAIDDDFDGLIDLNDTTDCLCEAVFGGEVTSLIPNPSFEDFTCVPTTFSELYCADTWEQATEATSDYFMSGGLWPPELPQPVPDGNAVAGFIVTTTYSEFVGGCLLSPMEAGVQQTLQMGVAGASWSGFDGGGVFYGPVEITIYGSASCPAWPIFANYGCPVGVDDWVELGSVTYTADATWQPVSITFTPTTDIQAVIIGGPCNVPPDFVNNGWYPYFWVDDLTLNESSLFGSTVTQTGGFCTGDVVLHGNPDEIATGYQWYQNGVALIGQTDSLLQISVLGLDSGLYQFQALLEDTACSISPFFVQPPVYPEPLIGAVPTAGCGPLDVNFTNLTDPALTETQSWDFGVNGGTSTNADPSFTFTEPGLYDVTLTVTSPDGCVSDTTYVDLIEVYDFPAVDFTSDVQEGCVGVQIQFTNNSTLTGNCVWDFGDGGSSLNCDAVHTFNTAGLWDVSLTVTSPQGCTSDTTFSQYINVYSFPNVSFTSDTVAGCTPLTITFTNTTPGFQVGSQAWDLGNGVTSTDSVVTTVYDTPGSYTVNLEVTAPGGCAAALNELDYITAYGHPEVSLFNTPDSGCYVLGVQFNNTTDPLFTGQCIWDFGDGSTSNNCDPFHDYSDPGVYEASLHVISPQNCVGDTAYTTITVFDHPEAAFVFGPQPTDYFNTYISFFDSSSVDAIEWSWAFGQDGILGASQQENPALNFPDNDFGTYPVQLIVTNANTCTDTATALVEIGGYYSVYAPNAFTPDGDGINERFRPIIMDQEEKLYRLSIFDRWGQPIWTSTNPDEGWDGTMGGEKIKTDVYIWKLETRDLFERLNHEYFGHVTLLK